LLALFAMPKLATRYFQELDYSEDAVYHFAAGIPGFEEHTDYLFIEQPATKPLVFMQSLRDPGICFIGLSATTVDPEYKLQLTTEEGVALGLPLAEHPTSKDLLAISLLTFAEDSEPVANLMSPIVLNLQTHRGIQAIQLESQYPLRHPLELAGRAATCS